MKLSDVLGSIAEHKFEKLHEQGFSNGLVAMMRALEKGQSVGILTARSSQKANEPIISLIERYTQTPIKYKFFVNDPATSKHLNGSSTALKKLQILIEFRNGIGQADKKYSKVKLFDDEDFNLDTVENRQQFIEELGFKKVKLDNIRALDIKKFDYAKLDKEITKSKNTVSFFDLDGTLIHTNAKINIIDSTNNKKLDSMTQEEFAVHGHDRIAKALKANKNAVFDLSEFTHAKHIKKQAKLESLKRKGKNISSEAH